MIARIPSEADAPEDAKLKKRYSVPALTKSIAILELLAAREEGLTLTEIHQTLSIPKATAYMILQVMEEHCMVAKSADDRFQLGFMLYSLGMRYMVSTDLQKTAYPHMLRLTKQTGFVSHLGRIVENRVMFTEKAEPSSFIKFNTYIGLRSDIHSCSLGKVMAAYMDADEVDAILRAVGLTGYTPNTITDRDKFMRVLERIRETGYAIEDEEGELGVRCIGAAIFGKDGRVAGAISITALKSDLTPDLYLSVGAKVVAAANAISSVLGHPAPKEDTYVDVE